MIDTPKEATDALTKLQDDDLLARAHPARPPAA